MQRRVALLAIFTLLIFQFSQSSLFLFAQDEESSFFVSTTQDSTMEETQVKVQNLSSNAYESVEVVLPQSTKYNKSLTSKLNQSEVSITYNDDNHSLLLKWNEGSDQFASFILNNLTQHNNELFVQGKTDGKIEVEEKHKFTVTKMQVDKESNEEELTKETTAEKDTNVKKKATKDEKEKTIDEKEKTTDEAEKTIDEKEKTIDEKEKTIDEKEKTTDEAEKTIDEKEKTTNKTSKSNRNNKKSEEKNKLNEKSLENNDDLEGEKSGNENHYFGINAVYENALSGADANFQLELKLTGSKRVYKNVGVVVDIPTSEYVTFDASEENLTYLALSGVLPTYDEENSQLMYHFDEIERGKMYKTIISLQSLNGYTPNETPVELSGELTGEIHYTENDQKEEAEKGDVVTIELEANDSMVINASGAISISKTQVESEKGDFKYGDGHIVGRGEQVRWRLELEVPKKDRGQLYLNPDEKIIVTDTLPEGLEYVATDTGQASVDGQTITWELDSVDFEAQEEAETTLYSVQIDLLTKVTDNAPIDKLQNNAEATAIFIKEEEVSDSSSRTITVAKDNPGTGDVKGNIFIPHHIGPTGTVDVKNPRPSVTDDERLTYRFSMAPLPESFPNRKGDDLKEPMNFKKYNIEYKIDDNLTLEILTAPGPFEFRPNISYPKGELFAVQPKYAIKGIVDGEERTLLSADKVIFKAKYTREQLGLQPGEHLSHLTLEFQKGYRGNSDDVAPGGLRAANNAYLEFSIKEGTRGTVENTYNVVGINGKNEPFDRKKDDPDSFDNSSSSDISGPRQATVVDYGAADKPVGQVSVKLLEDIRGIVSLGNNRMQVELRNINNSKAPMDKDLEAVVLLPPGVTLHDEVNPTYTRANGKPDENASFEVMDDDYNGSGRQLVKVKWADDNRMTKGNKVRAELDVYINDHAPSHLLFDVYGFSNNDNLTAPSNTDGGLTDTVLQTDSENFYGKGEDHPRLKSGNQYTLSNKYNIKTEKLIKGPKDDEYSKFTLATYGDSVKYKLKMTNTLEFDLSMMTLIDVLPSVDDLGITDNVNRGSKFTPTLEGPITIPSEWEGKVSVFYSEAKNPERDDLTRYTKYESNATKLSNPEGAEAPNWMTESDVEDWSMIHSFKIELKKGSTWIKGQDIEVDFSMKMPAESDVSEEVKDMDLTPHQRAAWNSFAVATDEGHPVEPERVGVALDLTPDTPDVEKFVEDNDGEYVKELVEKEREKNYKYHVDTVVPENLSGVQYITLSDELDERLELKGAIALVDDEEVDYEVTVDEQLATLTLERGQLDEIAGKKLTLEITAQIRKDVKVEIIGNKADIQVNNNPRKETNEVPVTPPPVPPTPEKSVENNDGEYVKELVEKEREKDYNYRVDAEVPEDLAGFEYIILRDELDERLEVQGAQALVDGEAVDYDVSIDGQLVTLKVARQQLDEIAGQTLTLEITSQIREGVKVEVIGNEAELQVNNDPKVKTNEVPVTPPPVPPTPEKSVENNDGEYVKELVEKEREKDYNYRVDAEVPEDLAGFEYIILTDKLDERLEVQGAQALVDGEAVDYDVSIDGQLVTLKVARQQLDEIAGQTLTLEITSQIREGVKVEVIGNEAELQVNNNPKVKTNEVPVTPPPVPPTPEKSVENNDGEYVKELVEKEREKDYNYRVDAEVPEDLAGFEYIILRDELDERLEVQGAQALVDGEAVDYDVSIDGQLVTLKVARQQLDEIAGQTLTLEITSQIREGVKVEVIDNKADIQVNNNPKKESNVVPVIPPTPPTEPLIDKDVEGVGHLDIDYNKPYNYNVTTTLPSNIDKYESFVVTDQVDQGLVIEDVKVTVDRQVTEAVDVAVDGNLVTATVTDFENLAGKKQIELVITAKIHSDTDVRDYKDNKIPNTADLNFINESGTEDKLTTNPVTVTPPPEDLTVSSPPEGPIKLGGLLPKTATNIMNLLAVGLVLITIGGVIVLYRRRKA